jgi:uncharacterized protein (TIGR03435 family)
MMVGSGSMVASGVGIAQIVNFLAGQVGRTVVDNTGLKGFFDVRLEFAPQGGGPGGLPAAPPSPVSPGATASDPTGPSIFTAIQEQLGLRLESARGPVEVLVIDSVRKATEN